MKYYAFDMIKTLRNNEEIILFENILVINEVEESKIKEFLKNEYEEECLDYPFEPPKFNTEAAFWAAKTVYISAQLLLYRKHNDVELEQLLPIENIKINASTMLSSDLCLRFLPILLEQLKIIDSEDMLIEILEKILKKWHYSGVNYSLGETKINKDDFENKTFKQLYVNRIVTNKNTKLAKIEPFNKWIKSDLSIFENELWSDFKTITNNEEH